MEKKLTSREKVAVWCLFFLARWMMPYKDMDDNLQKLVDAVQHELRHNM